MGGGALKKFFKERRVQMLREATKASQGTNTCTTSVKAKKSAKKYNADGRAWFGRIMKEASARHLSIEQVVVEYSNRIRRTSLRLLDIGGFRCHAYHLRDTRVAGDIRYAMLGITRQGLETCAFVIVYVDPSAGNDEILIIPSRDLLQHFPEDLLFKRFYMSLEQIHGSAHHGRGRHATIDWSHYRSAWHLLAPTSVLASV